MVSWYQVYLVSTCGGCDKLVPTLGCDKLVPTLGCDQLVPTLGCDKLVPTLGCDQLVHTSNFLVWTLQFSLYFQRNS